MLDKPDGVKHRADLVSLTETASESPLVSRYVRGQSFLIEWLDAKANAPALQLSSDDETILMTFDASARIAGRVSETGVAGRTVVVLPAGDFQIYLGPGRAAVLSTSRKGVSASALNAASYGKRDERVSPLEGAWNRRNDAKELQIFEIDKVKAPADNPRLKMFQSATMSINWVDYDGPRNRKSLSPHFHDDFEQASLAAAGNFVHHLRVTWGSDADEWRDDVHMEAGSPSVLVIPPKLIHTSEGVGPGRHLLIDVFTPPRRDFIAKKWMLNSSEYLDPRKK
jgi:hypothetical protein